MRPLLRSAVFLFPHLRNYELLGYLKEPRINIPRTLKTGSDSLVNGNVIDGGGTQLTTAVKFSIKGFAGGGLRGAL